METIRRAAPGESIANLQTLIAERSGLSILDAQTLLAEIRKCDKDAVMAGF